MSVTPSSLLNAIVEFVTEDSEGGRRAQACVAGLFDSFAGEARVVSRKINDPSRRYPGDVTILSTDDLEQIERAVEVKDKPVSLNNVKIFANGCLGRGVRSLGYVAVAAGQVRIDPAALDAWAEEVGVGITLFYDWSTLVSQALFWGTIPQLDAASYAALRIRERLVNIEAAPTSVARWEAMIAGRALAA